jgi:hypothetical protein
MNTQTTTTAKRLTPEQKEANKLARQEARKEAKRLAKIEAERNQKPVKSIDFSIEWKKSRTWGNCPRLDAFVIYKDGTTDRLSAYASGCGYDKESTVLADVFNSVLKYKIYQIPEGANLPYGIRADLYKGFSGGIGVNCYYEIGKAIGGTFVRTATGKTFDAYKYTDNE